MTETVPHVCVLCKESARRLHVPDDLQYVIDCARCGSYAISIELDQASRGRPHTRSLRTARRLIKPANARGMRLDIDTGRELPLE